MPQCFAGLLQPFKYLVRSGLKQMSWAHRPWRNMTKRTSENGRLGVPDKVILGSMQFLLSTIVNTFSGAHVDRPNSPRDTCTTWNRLGSAMLSFLLRDLLSWLLTYDYDLGTFSPLCAQSLHLIQTYPNSSPTSPVQTTVNSYRL